MSTSEEKFGIDHTRDDVFIATTEAQAVIGEAMEAKGTNVLLVVNIAPDGSIDAIVSGLVDPALFPILYTAMGELEQHAHSEIEQEREAGTEPDECRTIQIQSLTSHGNTKN